MNVVASERAERSVELANRTLATYRQQNPPRPEALAAFSGWDPVDAVASRVFTTRATLMALVSIAEEFSLNHLVELSEDHAKGDRIVALLWDAQLDSSLDTWPMRTKLWLRYFGVDESAFEEREALDGFIFARNAIAHGLGSLTRKQRRKPDQATGQLRKAGIKLLNYTLVLDSNHVEHCAKVVKSYIQWLDAAARP